MPYDPRRRFDFSFVPGDRRDNASAGDAAGARDSGPSGDGIAYRLRAHNMEPTARLLWLAVRPPTLVPEWHGGRPELAVVLAAVGPSPADGRPDYLDVPASPWFTRRS